MESDFETFRSEDPEWIDFDRKLRAWRMPKPFAFVHDGEAIGAVTFRAQRKPEFRSAREEENVLNELPIESRDFLPAGKLLPGERLIIPLQIGFRFEEPNDSIFVNFANANPRTRSRYLAKLSATPGAVVAVLRAPPDDAGRYEAEVSLSAHRLAAMLTRDDALPDLNDELIAGPSVKVESVVAAGAVRKVRPFDPQRVVLRGLSAEGKCPFVFTRGGKNERWHNEGVILEANRGAANAGTDSRLLVHFDGRVVLQELEPEVTTLDRAFVRAILADGSTREIPARDPLLREVDGATATVAPRRPLAIDFEMLAPIPGARYELVVHGHFTPLRR